MIPTKCTRVSVRELKVYPCVSHVRVLKCTDSWVNLYSALSVCVSSADYGERKIGLGTRSWRPPHIVHGAWLSDF